MPPNRFLSSHMKTKMIIPFTTLDDISKNFLDWSKEIERYWELYVGRYSEVQNTPKAESITKNTCEIFKYLLKLFVKHSRHNDDFTFSNSNNCILPAKEASVKSVKTGTKHGTSIHK